MACPFLSEGTIRWVNCGGDSFLTPADLYGMNDTIE